MPVRNVVHFRSEFVILLLVVLMARWQSASGQEPAS